MTTLLVKGSVSSTHSPRLPDPAPVPSGTRRRLHLRRQPLRRWEAWAGGLSWAVLLSVAVSIEPVASDPSAVPGWWEELWSLAFVAALGTALVGFARLAGWAFRACVVAAGLLTAAVTICPVSGHHVWGWWWAGQMACCVGLLAVGLRGSLTRGPASA